jgi:hypothetical protein
MSYIEKGQSTEDWVRFNKSCVEIEGLITADGMFKCAEVIRKALAPAYPNWDYRSEPIEANENAFSRLALSLSFLAVLSNTDLETLGIVATRNMRRAAQQLLQLNPSLVVDSQQLTLGKAQELMRSENLTSIGENDSLQAKLPEFSREIATQEELDQLAQTCLKNQQFWIANADKFGLNQEFLNWQMKNIPVAVGPFVSPAPISTTFAGSLANFQYSQQTGESLVQALQQRGRIAQQSVVIPLTMTEIPSRGMEAPDCFIVPQNQEVNKRIFMAGKPRRGLAYGKVNVTQEEFESQMEELKDAYNVFLTRMPELRRKKDEKKYGRILLEAIQSDLQTAYGSEKPDTVRYLDFAERLNQQIAKRIDRSVSAPLIYVDQMYYSPFIKEGISDIVQFTRSLEKIDFFNKNPNLFKVVNEKGDVQFFKLQEVGTKDILLKNTNDGETLTYSQLCIQNRTIAPCKELSYILSLSSMVPVMYGSQNSGGYYAPYAEAKQRITQLGAEPILYRTQPPISGDYRALDTVFDFYTQLLFPEGFNQGRQT